MMVDVQRMVNDQGQKLDIVEVEINNTAANVKSAVKEIQTVSIV